MSTLSAHVEDYITSRSYVSNSAKNRRTLLGRFIREVGDIEASTVELRHVLDWWDGISTLADASRAAHLSAVSGFLQHLITSGHLQTNPALALKRPKVQVPPPVVLTDAQVATVLDVVRNPLDRAIILMMLGSGLRSSDVAALRIENIDREGLMMTVTGKGAKTRAVPMPAVVLGAINRLSRDRTSGLLVECDGRTMVARADFVRARAQNVLVVAGVKLHALDKRSPHVLRRTFATKLIDNGVPITVVQEILGHESLETTRRYVARSKSERLVEAVKLGPLADMALPRAA